MSAPVDRETTETLHRDRAPREGAVYPRPHVHAVAITLGKLLGLHPKHAARRMDAARQVNDRIVLASQQANRPNYPAEFFSHVDALRCIDGSPITFESGFACLIQRDVLAEAESLTRAVADLSATHCNDLARKTAKLRRELDELDAALLARKSA